MEVLLTWVHLADLLYESLIKACDYGATYWNHKVLVQALNKRVNSSHTSPLMKIVQEEIEATTLSVTSDKSEKARGNHRFVFRGKLQFKLQHATASKESKTIY